MLMDAWRGCERCCRGGRGYPCYADTSPSWAVPCLGEGERLGGDACLSPLSPSPADRYVSAGQAATRAWTGASSSLWAQRLHSDGEACNPEGLVGNGGKERLIRQKKVPDNKLPAGLEWCTHFTG